MVKRMFLYPVRYRLGMMLRTYRKCAKVVTSFELQNTPIGEVTSCYTIKIHFPRSRSNPRVHVPSNAHRNNLISRSNPHYRGGSEQWTFTLRNSGLLTLLRAVDRFALSIDCSALSLDLSFAHQSIDRATTDGSRNNQSIVQQVACRSIEYT